MVQLKEHSTPGCALEAWILCESAAVAPEVVLGACCCNAVPRKVASSAANAAVVVVFAAFFELAALVT